MRQRVKAKKGPAIKLAQLVRVYEFGPVETAEGAPLHFRIEVLRHGALYRARVLRWDMFSIEPTQPRKRVRRMKAECLLLVQDDFAETLSRRTYRSIERLLSDVVGTLSKQLGRGLSIAPKR